MTSHHGFPSGPKVNQLAKITLPCCVRLIPHPDSEPAGFAHQIAWWCATSARFGSAPQMHIGTGLPKTCLVISLVWCTPLTVYSNVPLFASVNVSVAVPTFSALTAVGSNGTELNGGPVPL